MTRAAGAISFSILLWLGCDDGRPSSLDDAGARDDAGAGPGSDAGASDAGPGPGADAGAPPAVVGLTFDGCAPDFGGDLVVTANAESIAVGSLRGGALAASLQLALAEPPGTIALSTRHRVDSGTVINLVIDSTWTNIARDSGGVLGGSVADPIGGQLVVRAHDRAAARLDVDFVGVTLENPGTGVSCRIDGRLETLGR